MEEKIEYFIYYDIDIKVYTIGYFDDKNNWIPLKDFNNVVKANDYLIQKILESSN